MGLWNRVRGRDDDQEEEEGGDLAKGTRNCLVVVATRRVVILHGCGIVMRQES